MSDIYPAGKLDRLIRIEKRKDPPDRDDYGQVIEDWEQVAIIYAHKRDAKGDEKFAAQQITGEVDTFWEMRYRADVDNAMRLVHLHDNSIHEIVAPPIELLKFGRRTIIEIQTKKTH